MKQTCAKCGAELPEDAAICPQCKTIDPLGRTSDQAERFIEEQVESASGIKKK